MIWMIWRSFTALARPYLVLVLLLVSLRSSEPTALVLKETWLPDIRVETYKLENGLTVTLHEDHHTRLVAVHVTYNVGSKDDPPGRSGLAHLYEHLMFEGSEHSDSSYYGPIIPTWRTPTEPPVETQPTTTRR